MGMIAEMFVRVKADGASSFSSEMRRVSGSMDVVDKAGERLGGRIKLMSDRMIVSESSAQKLKGGLATLASQATGMNPAITQLASTIGSLAVSGPIVAGVLLGIGAISGAYNLLTKGAREASKATDDMIANFREAMRLEKMGPGAHEQDIKKGAKGKLKKARERLTVLNEGINSAKGTTGGFTRSAVQQAQFDKTLAEIRRLQTDIADAERKINEARLAAIKDVAPTIASSSQSLGEAIVQNIHKGIAGSPGIALTGNNAAMTPGELRPRIAEFGVEAQRQWDSMLQQGEAIKAAADANAQNIKGAIANAASQIVGALNIGGGGKGSSLGGGLLGGLGGSLGAAGGTLGFLGGPLGSVLGSVVGSWIGGLFDKKEVNETTKAVVGLGDAAKDVAASLRNLPSGFRIELYRYKATVPKKREGEVTPPPPREGGPGGSTGPGEKKTIVGGTFNFYGVQNIEDFAQKLEDFVGAKNARGGVNGLRYVFGSA